MQTRQQEQSSSPWTRFLVQWRAARRQRHLRGRSMLLAQRVQQIPAMIRTHWLAHAGEEIPGWRPSEADWPLVAGALMQFFDACRGAPDCALPSRAADSLWHVWLARDPAGLASFQCQHFGREMPHVEGADIDLEAGLARCWVQACRSEGLSPTGERLPLVFSADKLLATPTGWAYDRGPYQIVHRDLDGRGRPVGEFHTHQGLLLAGLAGMGLLHAHELEAQPQRKPAGDSGSNCGSSYLGSTCGTSSSGDCGAGSDAGSAGCSCSSGSSCGSSCGGGGN